MKAPIDAVIDWLNQHAAQQPADQLALYGVSGGGYFTAQAVANNPRIKAWVASTPIMDISAVFKKELGPVGRTPGWVSRTVMSTAGNFNASAELTIKKYSWQFGVSDFLSAVREIIEKATPLDPEAIHCPCLLMVGESEGSEMKRQTLELGETLFKLGRNVTVRTFSPEDGADAHCQVNHFKLAHAEVFDWLDRIFQRQDVTKAIDPRMLV